MSEHETTTSRFKIPSLKVLMLYAIFSVLSYAGWDYGFDLAEGYCIGPVCIGVNTTDAPINEEQGDTLE